MFARVSRTRAMPPDWVAPVATARGSDAGRDRTTGDSQPDFLDFTPLARLCGIEFEVRIAPDLVARAKDETVLRCVLRAAADALRMRGPRMQAMNPMVFAIKALRAPAQLATQWRLALLLQAGAGNSRPVVHLALA